MEPKQLAALHPPDTELVLGIVAAVGTDIDRFEGLLADYLKKFKYAARSVPLTDFFARFDLASKGIKIDHEDPCTRISLRMDAGNRLRRDAKRGDLLALHAAFDIRKARKARAAEETHCCAPHEIHSHEIAALDRTAYVLRQLKHPDEVNTLRRIYGNGFFLIALYSTKNERYEFLTKRKSGDPAFVEKLMERDEREDDPFGQKMRDTFALADVFIRLGGEERATREELERFLGAVFGHPYTTPTRDEHAMYLAFGASLRSADLSRQVGAAITNARGDVIAVGSNDIPCPGGGQYWPGSDDKRDYKLGHDANELKRNEIILEIMRSFGKSGSPEELLAEGEKLLADTRIRELIEFSRAVHAEMDALMACARIGVSPRGGTLYCTTFPCHICAKHIVDAGIARVVYIEPYAKSLAVELHGDAIAVEEDSENVRKRVEEAKSEGKPALPAKVLFEPFVGVGPRHFPHLFAIRLGNGYPVRRKGAGGRTIEWDHARATLRAPNIPFSYVERERFASSVLEEAMKGEDDESSAKK